jgi:steroid 5-alpha reductase family enzyme
MWLISAPLLGAQFPAGQSPLNLLDVLGIGVWLLGITFEAGSDWQLARFKRDAANKGKLVTRGFWRYTRHPNYFGDSAVWWGYGLICLANGSYLPVLGAVLMTLLILRVSGVPLLEQSMSRKPGYAEYARRTSAFLPWFPSRS